MEKDQMLVEIGYISKAHGIKGEIFLRLYDGDMSYFEKGMELFLDKEKYLLEKIRPHKEGAILILEGVNTRNLSEELRSKKVFINSNLQYFNEAENEIFLFKLLAFRVSLKGVYQGKVSGFAKTEAHDLIKVKIEDGSLLEIPWVDEFLIKVDMEEEVIDLDCPLELFNPDFFKGVKA